MTRLFALSLLALVLAAPASAASSSTILHISALGSGLRYSTTHLKAVHGKVTIVMKNLSPLQHDIAIKGNGVTAKGKVVGKGKTSTVTVTLKKGVYTFYCSVDAHAAAGMKGTLTIS